MATDCIYGDKSLNKDGYSHFMLNKKHLRTHKYLYELKYGKVPAGKVLDHLCRNRACINTDHLEVVSQAENTRRGRVAKINMESAAIIRAVYKSKALNQKEIADIYKVGQDEISRIVNYRRWV